MDHGKNGKSAQGWRPEEGEMTRGGGKEEERGGSHRK